MSPVSSGKSKSDTACALLYAKLQREDAAMMETALDRPAADSTLPPEVRRCRGHAPTREAPDARRAGRCRQRLPEVRNGVERAWKAALRRCGRVVPVVRRRSASRFREHLPGSRARPIVHPGRLAPLVQREATGAASIEDGASLPLPPDERDTTHDLRGVVTCRDHPKADGRRRRPRSRHRAPAPRTVPGSASRATIAALGARPSESPPLARKGKRRGLTWNTPARGG